MVREQLGDPMVLILLVAATLSALLQEWAEAGIIFVIVVVNAVIGIVQERKAQSSLEALRQMSAPVAHVLRGGVEELVPARDLVPGDVVMLADGSMVPADLRLLDTASLRVQEASLTGESVPAEKDAQARVAPGAPLGDRATMAFATAIVTGGRGVGVVVATGMGTEVGRIAGLLEGDEELDTPLKRKLAAFGKVLTVVGVAAALAVIALGCSTGGSSSPCCFWPYRWPSPSSPKACPPRPPSSWRWACSAWRATRRSCAACQPWRPWEAPPSSARTRRARSPRTA